MRPIAVQYGKITTQRERQLLSNFFANLESPITIGNEFLQARPRDGLIAACRFTINSTLGVLGFFDPSTRLGLESVDTDFGVTLAVWGFGDGPYLVLPFFGATSVRDAWSIPVDTYFFSPLYYYSSSRTLAFGAQYAPTLLYLITLRSSAIDAESLLEGAFDPYTFYRDAYRQRRVFKIYRGNPPDDVVRALGQETLRMTVDSLIEEQRRYESDGEID